ncbi:MAG: Fic family protein [Planctomycetes bacterium]|nr:Fic family protein [Planctomycetota bacterium]
MTFDPVRPFDALPPLPPRTDTETAPVLKQCLRATRALAELKGAGGLIPDQAILINSIPLQEAQASSEIENILTTQDALFRAALDGAKSADPQTKEVLRYRTALRGGYEAVKERGLSMELLREVCCILRDEAVDFRKPGEDVCIGNPQTRKIRYTPPRGGSVISKKLKNLESYLLANDGPDELIRMAVAHYQFEATHPFLDGNGRTGRILNILYLVHAGLLDLPVLYLSRYLIRHKGEYYRLLLDVSSSQAWEPWIIYMLRGIEETARWTTDRTMSIRRLLDETIERVRRDLPRIYSKELVELLFHQPYCKNAFLVDGGIAKRQTAAEYLRALEGAGVLASEMVGRERIFVNSALLALLKEARP